MKRTIKSLFILFIVVFFLSTAFSIRDPKPDYSTATVELNSLVHLSDIATENEVDGFFKSSIDFALMDFDTDVKGFYGQEIKLVNNASVDRIRIGVKTNLIARVELWKGSDCIAVEELGFMKKMTSRISWEKLPVRPPLHLVSPFTVHSSRLQGGSST